MERSKCFEDSYKYSRIGLNHMFLIKQILRFSFVSVQIGEVYTFLTKHRSFAGNLTA